MLPCKYPVLKRIVFTLREDMPPRQRGNFVFPFQKDNGMANLLLPGRSALQDPSVFLHVEDHRKMEQDQRTHLSLLSMAMWSFIESYDKTGQTPSGGKDRL